MARRSGSKRSVIEKLLLSKPIAAQKQLKEWEAYTIRNLKLEKYI